MKWAISRHDKFRLNEYGNIPLPCKQLYGGTPVRLKSRMMYSELAGNRKTYAEMT